jgi:Ca2+:H+ antiporter
MTGERPLDAALTAARQIAASEGHAFVGTEHLLAALLDDPTGLTGTLFERAGKDPVALRGELLKGMRKAREPVEPTTLPTSRQATRVLERAGQGPGDEKAVLAALLTAGGGRIPRLLPPDSAAYQALSAAVGAPPPSPPRPSKETSAPPASPPREPRARGKKGKADRSEEPRGQARSRPERPAPRREPEPESEPARPRDDEPLPIVKSLLEPQRRRFPWSLLLLVAVPISLALQLTGGPPAAVFATACIAVLPLAGLMGTATEALAARWGPATGGLLNATFGNAAELIIAIAALRSGLVDLVKASITGSILGNLLLILGLSCLAGRTERATIKFSRTNAGMSAAMLALAVIGLLFPALFHTAHPDSGLAELHLSEIVAGILIVTYGFSLLFSLRTHRDLFGVAGHDDGYGPRWDVRVAVGVLVLATAGVWLESELLVRTVETVTHDLGLSELFLGLIVIPVIGNAAEHASAIMAARKGQMDLAFQIALGSSTQIALLVAPVLVYIGLAVGTSMNLVFAPFEVLALAVSTLVIAIITLDGETHWFEGVQLLAVYGLIATAAYFI